GFNDHRAGFNGGALKTGVLPVRSLNPAALAELKKKHKHTRDLKNASEEVTTFTPLEAVGGGKLVNTPLSMHFEMMAIHSAFSTSTTLASTNFSSQKLPRNNVSVDRFKSGDLKALHLNQTFLNVAPDLTRGHVFHAPMEDKTEEAVFSQCPPKVKSCAGTQGSHRQEEAIDFVSEERSEPWLSLSFRRRSQQNKRQAHCTRSFSTLALGRPSGANIASQGTGPEPSVLANRPCYRCIAYMNSVGIKRVFWMAISGEWECAKVRDLVDALNDLGLGDAADAHAARSSVFVTKHEVLMLRRTMGGDVE
ncbi:hypothetical protein PSPO01_01492, partial [Paraphaeosphaeria sporulosa]